ncbi:MAG: hypothetical protein PUA78_02235 [Porphyromonadaceae bacterium]|nr:hypothetical protein [Porphyromonadaceae bacterium]MDD6313823.1 hypothetical protein [Porphyromonadaceae bacterium]
MRKPITLPALLPALLLLCACSRKVYVPVESRTATSDTLRIVERRGDTLLLRDSVVMRVAGDTVVKEVWRERGLLRGSDRVRDRTVRDTVLREVPVAVPSEDAAQKERRPSLLERLREAVKSALLLVCLTLLIIYLWKSRKS